MNELAPKTEHRSVEFHHFGVMVRDLSIAAQYYATSLGYEARSGIIHDPVQGALVQFLALPRTRHYLELITPDSFQSVLTNSLKRGTGLHHICFSTVAIEESVQSLRNGGALLLQAPVAASAFRNRRIAWLMDRTRTLLELVERDGARELELSFLTGVGNEAGGNNSV
jgi:4-hydroxyphenylpyruvate dioxygenase-like putative hemolysin